MSKPRSIIQSFIDAAPDIGDKQAREWAIASMAYNAARDAMEDAERYRHVRTLSPRAFTDLHMRNIAGEGNFDVLVDQDIEMRDAAMHGAS